MKYGNTLKNGHGHAFYTLGKHVQSQSSLSRVHRPVLLDAFQLSRMLMLMEPWELQLQTHFDVSGIVNPQLILPF